MYFREMAEHGAVTSEPDIDAIIAEQLSRVMLRHGLTSGFFCQWDDCTGKANVLASHRIPIEPFRGSQCATVSAFVAECISVRCAARMHKVVDTPLWHAIKSVMSQSNWRSQALFVPAYSGDFDFVFVAFVEADGQVAISGELRAEITDLADLTAFLLSAGEREARARVTEIYIREVGHDIASSVQAIVAKLRNVSRGLLVGDAAMQKVREAEAEMMSAYRSADTLGITVDPDYNLSGADEFSISQAIHEVVELCRSEAEERHIEMRTALPDSDIKLWGDKKAIQSAMTQLVLNAIKYARGSSVVSVKLEVRDNDVVFIVRDRGVPLDDEERLHMWDFGWRGQRAKELHVNGSGIGLYTVRKIVRAHGGRWGSKKVTHADDVAVFFITLPRARRRS